MSGSESRCRKSPALLEEAEDDLLAFHGFPADHWAKLRSTNPLERVNREIGRRTDVVGIFPNDRSLIRLAASVVIDAHQHQPPAAQPLRITSEAQRPPDPGGAARAGGERGNGAAVERTHEAGEPRRVHLTLPPAVRMQEIGVAVGAERVSLHPLKKAPLGLGHPFHE